MSVENIRNTLKAIIPQGKISTKPGEITPQYVMAICRIYETRADGEHEYMIEEYGIVERSMYNSLDKCYEEAANLAFRKAITHLQGSVMEQPGVSMQQQAEVVMKTDLSLLVGKDTASSVSDSGIIVETANTETDNVEDGAKDSIDDNSNLTIAHPPTIEKLDLNQNISTIKTIDNEPSDPIQKARERQITIVGKLHTCYNWPAGKILDEMPDVIVGFAPKYSGEKTEEKEALMVLYPEAVRKVQKAV